MNTAPNYEDEVGFRPRVEIRTYTPNAQGKLEELACYPFTHYGTCPNVGDTILEYNPLSDEPLFFSVQRRYFVDEHDGFTGWALMLRPVEATGPPRQVWDEWVEATEFWNEVEKKEHHDFMVKHGIRSPEHDYEDLLALRKSSAKATPPKSAKVGAGKALKRKPISKKAKTKTARDD